MTNVPISPAAFVALRELENVIRSGKPVTVEFLQEATQSPFAEVQCRACTFVFDYPERILDLPDRWRVTCTLCLLPLLDASRQDARNEYRLTRFDALSCIGGLFEGLWKARTDHQSELIQIRDSIAEQCRSPDGEQVDAVVTGLLEHLFQDKEKVQFFHSWRGDKRLAAVFDESCRLADGFTKLRDG